MASPRVEGQHPAVLEHHHRLARHLARERYGARRLQLDRALVDVGPLEQSQPELFEEDPSHGGVHRLHGDEAAPERLAEVRNAIVRGQLDVEPGAKRQGGGLRAVPGEVVVLVEEADADVVGRR